MKQENPDQIRARTLLKRNNFQEKIGIQASPFSFAQITTALGLIRLTRGGSLQFQGHFKQLQLLIVALGKLKIYDSQTKQQKCLQQCILFDTQLLFSENRRVQNRFVLSAVTDIFLIKIQSPLKQWALQHLKNQFLNKSRIFRNLYPKIVRGQNQKSLYQILKSCQIRSLPIKHKLYEQNQMTRAHTVLLKGKVRFQKLFQGRKIVLTEVSQYGIILSSFRDVQYSFTAQSRSQILILQILKAQDLPSGWIEQFQQLRKSDWRQSAWNKYKQIAKIINNKYIKVENRSHCHLSLDGVRKLLPYQLSCFQSKKIKNIQYLPKTQQINNVLQKMKQKEEQKIKKKKKILLKERRLKHLNFV